MSQIPKPNIILAADGAKIRAKVNGQEVFIPEESLDIEANKAFNHGLETGKFTEDDRSKFMSHYSDTWKKLARDGVFNIDTAGPDGVIGSTYEGNASASQLGQEDGHAAERSKFGRFFTNKVKDTDAGYMSVIHGAMNKAIGSLGLSTLKTKDEEAAKLKAETDAKNKLAADEEAKKWEAPEEYSKFISRTRFGGQDFKPLWQYVKTPERLSLASEYANSLYPNLSKYKSLQGSDTSWANNFAKDGKISFTTLPAAQEFFSRLGGTKGSEYLQEDVPVVDDKVKSTSETTGTPNQTHKEGEPDPELQTRNNIMFSPENGWTKSKFDNYSFHKTPIQLKDKSNLYLNVDTGSNSKGSTNPDQYFTHVERPGAVPKYYKLAKLSDGTRYLTQVVRGRDGKFQIVPGGKELPLSEEISSMLGVRSNEEGGVLSFQAGGQFDDEGMNAISSNWDAVNNDIKSKITPNPNVKPVYKEKTAKESVHDLSDEDKADLLALTADVGGLVASFIPGASVGAGGAGLVSTGATLYSDIKKHGWNWSDAGGAAVSGLLDIASMIPGAGIAAKTGKIGRTVAKSLPLIARALTVAGTLEGGKAALITLDKIKQDGGVSNLSLDDWKTLANSLRLLSSGHQVRQANRALGESTEVMGKVRVNGQEIDAPLVKNADGTYTPKDPNLKGAQILMNGKKPDITGSAPRPINERSTSNYDESGQKLSYLNKLRQSGINKYIDIDNAVRGKATPKENVIEAPIENPIIPKQKTPREESSSYLNGLKRDKKKGIIRDAAPDKAPSPLPGTPDVQVDITKPTPVPRTVDPYQPLSPEEAKGAYQKVQDALAKKQEWENLRIKADEKIKRKQGILSKEEPKVESELDVQRKKINEKIAKRKEVIPDNTEEIARKQREESAKKTVKMANKIKAKAAKEQQTKLNKIEEIKSRQKQADSKRADEDLEKVSKIKKGNEQNEKVVNDWISSADKFNKEKIESYKSQVQTEKNKVNFNKKREAKQEEKRVNEGLDKVTERVKQRKDLIDNHLKKLEKLIPENYKTPEYKAALNKYNKAANTLKAVKYKTGGVVKAQNGLTLGLNEASNMIAKALESPNTFQSNPVSQPTKSSKVGSTSLEGNTVWNRLAGMKKNFTGKEANDLSELGRLMYTIKRNNEIPTTVHISPAQAPAETPISVKGDYTTRALFENKANDLVNSVSKPGTSDIVSNTLMKMQANKQAQDISNQGIQADVQARKASEQASTENIIRNQATRAQVANENGEMLAKKRQAEQDMKANIDRVNTENVNKAWATKNYENKADLQQKQGILQQYKLQQFGTDLYNNEKYKGMLKELYSKGYDSSQLSPDNAKLYKEYQELQNRGQVNILMGKDPFSQIASKKDGGNIDKKNEYDKEIWKQRNDQSKRFSDIYDRWMTRKLKEQEKDDDKANKSISDYISKILK